MSMLPPTPADVTRYFSGRRSRLDAFTEEDIAANDRLWLNICGLAKNLPTGALPSTGEVADTRNDPSLVSYAPELSVTCQGCGQAFTPKRSDARTCSSVCRKRISRRAA